MIMAKIALIVDIFWDYNPQQSSHNSWYVCLVFLVGGCMQFGVLGAFFLLTSMDASLLDHMMNNENHTLAEIIIWNHARHVTVCILHLAIVWSIRHHLARNAHGVHKTFVGHTNFVAFQVGIYLLPLLIGLLHSWLFDDQKLYMFGNKDIGSYCQLWATVCSATAGLYYIQVPINGVATEHTDPENVVSVIWKHMDTWSGNNPVICLDDMSITSRKP